MQAGFNRVGNFITAGSQPNSLLLHFLTTKVHNTVGATYHTVT